MLKICVLRTMEKISYFHMEHPIPFLTVLFGAIFMIRSFAVPGRELPGLIFTLAQAIQLPICIGLTLRVSLKKKAAPVIPSQPLFHNDPYVGGNSDEDDGNQIELGPLPQNGCQSSQDLGHDLQQNEGLPGQPLQGLAKPCDDQVQISHHM